MLSVHEQRKMERHYFQIRSFTGNNTKSCETVVNDIRKYLKHYITITSYIKRLENVFSFGIFMQCLISAITICISALSLKSVSYYFSNWANWFWWWLGLFDDWAWSGMSRIKLLAVMIEWRLPTLQTSIGVEFASILVYIICVVFQVSFYCHYGNEIFIQVCSPPDKN